MALSLETETIYSIIQEHADIRPNETSILGVSGNPLSYKDLKTQVDYIKRVLNEHGITQNDPVSIVIPNGPEMAVVFLAVSSTSICAPLNPNYKTEEYTFFLTDLKPKALITLSGRPSPSIDVAEKLGIDLIYLTPSEQDAGIFTLDYKKAKKEKKVLDYYPTGQNIALILHTSGTTSRPKMVPLTHDNLCKSAQNIRHTLKLTPEDRCLNVMP